MLPYFIFFMLTSLMAQQIFSDYDLLSSFPYQQLFPQSPHFQSFESELTDVSPISQKELMPPYENIFLSNGVTSKPFPRSLSPSLMSLFTRPVEIEPPRASNGFSTFPITLSSSMRTEYGDGSGSSGSYQLSTPEYSRRDSASSWQPYVNRRIEERIVDKILDNLPALAASFMGFSVTAQKPRNYLTSSEIDRRDDRTIDSADFHQKPSSIVDMAPEPSSILSFGKLMSSLRRQSTSSEINPKFLGGTPLSKSEDGESSTLTTPAVNPEDKSLLSQILRSVLRSTGGKNYTVDRRRDASFVWTHSNGAEAPDEIPITDKPFFERLMNGDFQGLLKSIGNESKTDDNRTDKSSMDPLKSLFTALAQHNTDSSGEEGHPLIQLFGKASGGNGNPLGQLSQFFGSGLDDDPSVPYRRPTRNF